MIKLEWRRDAAAKEDAGEVLGCRHGNTEIQAYVNDGKLIAAEYRLHDTYRPMATAWLAIGINKPIWKDLEAAVILFCHERQEARELARRRSPMSAEDARRRWGPTR